MPESGFEISDVFRIDTPKLTHRKLLDILLRLGGLSYSSVLLCLRYQLVCCESLRSLREVRFHTFEPFFKVLLHQLLPSFQFFDPILIHHFFLLPRSTVRHKESLIVPQTRLFRLGSLSFGFDLILMMTVGTHIPKLVVICAERVVVLGVIYWLEDRVTIRWTAISLSRARSAARGPDKTPQYTTRSPTM